MDTTRLPLFSLFSILAVGLIVGCQPTPVSPTATPVPASPTTTSKPAATATVRPLATATATFPPEIVATQPSDVAGVWRISYKGEGKTSPRTLRCVRTPRSCSRALVEGFIFEGIMRFADGKVTLDSDTCFDPSTGLEPCKMAFIIHSSMQEGRPGAHRIRSRSTKTSGVSAPISTVKRSCQRRRSRHAVRRHLRASPPRHLRGSIPVGLLSCHGMSPICTCDCGPRRIRTYPARASATKRIHTAENTRHLRGSIPVGLRFDLV